ncbi:MAG TPA: hypothetical protein VGR96_17580 [Acidobacteriaceae bacterium]|nr:hypothetical protein [Acidobacteriaceae bacterium]
MVGQDGLRALGLGETLRGVGARGETHAAAPDEVPVQGAIQRGAAALDETRAAVQDGVRARGESRVVARGESRVVERGAIRKQVDSQGVERAGSRVQDEIPDAAPEPGAIHCEAALRARVWFQVDSGQVLFRACCHVSRLDR